MNFEIKHFKELSIQELYELLRLRSQVFVVEQDCVYQDLDNKDQKALHILGYKGEKIVAYTRVFDAGSYFDTASIGRVVVDEKERAYGYGKKLMEESIQAIIKNFGPQPIKISAQCYLQKFYNDLGFQKISDEYLEDGIPHIGMVRE